MAENNRKLIFLDIDGTLTIPGRSVPPDSALRAIRAAQARGHLVAVCSGRCLRMLRGLLDYGFDAVIASAGEYIEYRGEVLFDHPMTEAQKQLALAAMQGAGLSCVLECRDGAFATGGFISLDKIRQEHPGATNSELERWRAALEEGLGIQPLTAYRGEPVYKVSFMGETPHPLDGPLFDELRKDFTIVVHDAETFGGFNGEIIHRQYHKGAAVRTLAARLGVAVEDTIAFGDSMNDYEMIVMAGMGVCMGNGSAALKAVADEVCGAVTEDGLARAFEALGLAPGL